jgi:hypothetical protein
MRQAQFRERYSALPPGERQRPGRHVQASCLRCHHCGPGVAGMGGDGTVETGLIVESEWAGHSAG